MSTAAVQPHPYVQSLLSGRTPPPSAAHAWLNERRGRALERANALSVPTTRDEEWRFTDLTQLTRLKLRPAGEKPAAVDPQAVDACKVPEAGARLTFVDGVYAPELSTSGDECSGVRVMPLSAAIASEGDRLEPYLAQLAAFDDDLFAALNTAYLQHGAVVIVPRDVLCDRPVHLLYLATQPNTAAYPRCLVVAEAGSSCSVVEEYVGLAEEAYFTNSVTEIFVDRAAQLRHIRVQREHGTAYHLARCAVSVERDASFFSHAVALGARLSRIDLSVRLRQGASAEIDGLALISGRQVADTHSLLDHSEPNGRSAQLHKTIVDGGAHAVFNGKIFVREGAQLTDSSQQSRNLLLSDKATVDAKPQLEIFADDVKCAHGATVGQLDREQLFYLVSRGFSERAARNLLTYAFGAAVIERIPLPSVVERLERVVLERTGANT